MWKPLTLCAAVAAGGLGLWVLAASAAPVDPARDYAALRAAELAADEAAHNSARWAAFWDLMTWVLFGAILLGLIAIGAILIDEYLRRRRRPDLVYIGPAPVAVADVVDGRAADLQRLAVAGHYQAAISAGRAVPTHYAPHISYPAGAGQLAAPPSEAEVPPFIVPTFGQVIDTGLLRDGAGYLMGYRLPDGAPIRLAQEDGRSFLAAGQGGSGKSTMIAVAALEELLMPPTLPGQQEPARFIVVDYHARKPQGLTRRLAGLDDRVLAWAHSPAEVAAAVKLFQETCRSRVDGAPAPWPIILLADEVSNMVDDPDYDDVIGGLFDAFKHANNAFRAVGGKAIVGVHTLQAYSWGGKAAIRQSFHARAAGRLDQGAGALIGLAPARARELISLPAGRCYLTAPGLPPTFAAAPNLAAGDVAAALDVAGPIHRARVVQPVPPLPLWWWDEVADTGAPRPVVDAIAVASPPAPGAPIDAIPVADPSRGPVFVPEISPETAEALRLFDGGADLPAAIEQAFGVKRNNPGAYSPPYRLVQAALRAQRGGGGGESDEAE